MTAFTRSQLNRIEHDHIRARLPRHLSYGVIEDIITTLDRTVERKCRLNKGACTGRVRRPVLRLGMQNDVEVMQRLVKYLWRRQRRVRR